MAVQSIDIKENDIRDLSPELHITLLKEHTMSTKEGLQVNIFGVTDNYEHFGEGYHYHDQIAIPGITGENGSIIAPRSIRVRQQQQQRSREITEVFAPSWICNAQNNLIDKAWFGCEGCVFNHEIAFIDLMIKTHVNTYYGKR